MAGHTDTATDLYIHIGADPTQHSLKVHGRPFNGVSKVVLTDDKEGAAVLTCRIPPITIDAICSPCYDGENGHDHGRWEGNYYGRVRFQLDTTGGFTECRLDGKPFPIDYFRVIADIHNLARVWLHYTRPSGWDGRPTNMLFRGMLLDEHKEEVV